MVCEVLTKWGKQKMLVQRYYEETWILLLLKFVKWVPICEGKSFLLFPLTENEEKTNLTFANQLKSGIWISPYLEVLFIVVCLVFDEHFPSKGSRLEDVHFNEDIRHGNLGHNRRYHRCTMYLVQSKKIPFFIKYSQVKMTPVITHFV